MSTTTPDRDQEAAKLKIIDAVSQRGKATQSAFLLSALGNQFAKELKVLKPFGMPLKLFMESFFADHLKLITLVQPGGIVHGVVPTEVDVPDPSAVIPQSSEPETSLRFFPTVWAALRVNMDPRT